MAPHAKDKTSNPPRSQWAGIGLVFLAALLWSLNGVLIKTIYEGGTGPGGVTIAFWRSAVAGVFLLPFCLRQIHTLVKLPPSVVGNQSEFKRPTQFAPSNPTTRLRLAVGLCVICFALMTTAFVVANTMTTAANAIILQYTSTFWVLGLAPWILRERASLRELGALGVALVGIGIIFAGSAATDLGGLLVALSAGLFYGLLTLMLRKVRQCDAAALTVANNLGTALLLLPLILYESTLDLPSRIWFMLVVMGVVQFGLPYYLFSLALRRVPAHHAALISMAEPILVPIWVYCAFGEVPPRMTVLGGIVILSALGLFFLIRRRGTG